MADARIERLADVVVSYSVGVEPGDRVLLIATPVAAPFVRELYRRILRAGGHPELRVVLDEAREALMKHGSDAQLDWVDPRTPDDAETAEARIAVLGNENRRVLAGTDPERQARISRAGAPYARRIIERAAAGEHRWNVTVYPTEAAAQEARMSLAAFERHVFEAGLLDLDDPVAAWRELGGRIARLAEWLHRVRELRIVAEDTDLTIAVDGRAWIVCDGHENFPDGECFTAPIETSAKGTIRFTYPAVFGSRSVADVRLRFEAGEVVEAHAAQGEAFLTEMLAVDDGSRRLGEFSFGLNDAVTAFVGEALLDEKIGGTMHLALGEAYPESGGTNRSALHWDMVCDLRRGGEVYADGELVYRDGRFLAGRFDA
jgi:aminopeptidase